MINFLLMGDEKYYHTLEVSITRIRKIYPESFIYLYDWGIDKENLKKISKCRNLIVIDWKHRIEQIIKKDSNLINKDDVEIYLYYPNSWIKKILIKFMSIIGKFESQVAEKILRVSNFEKLVHEKIACTQDCSNIVGDESIVFLDADAMLIDSIDEVIDQDIDVAVTLRRKDEIDFGMPCQVLNSGVLFFGKNKRNRNAFIHAWQEEAHKTKEPYVDQTSLTRLIEKLKPELYENYYTKGKLNVEGIKTNVLMLPCEVYNYNWIEEVAKDRKKIKNIKVLHFKGSRHNKKTFKNLLLDLDI